MAKKGHPFHLSSFLSIALLFIHIFDLLAIFSFSIDANFHTHTFLPPQFPNTRYYLPKHMQLHPPAQYKSLAPESLRCSTAQYYCAVFGAAMPYMSVAGCTEEHSYCYNIMSMYTLMCCAVRYVISASMCLSSGWLKKNHVSSFSATDQILMPFLLSLCLIVPVGASGYSSLDTEEKEFLDIDVTYRSVI